MVFFAKNQQGDVQETLFEALNGNKPFRKFKSALQNMNLDEQWYRFEQEYAKRKIKEWLYSHEIDRTKFTK